MGNGMKTIEPQPHWTTSYGGRVFINVHVQADDYYGDVQVIKTNTTGHYYIEDWDTGLSSFDLDKLLSDIIPLLPVYTPPSVESVIQHERDVLQKQLDQRMVELEKKFREVWKGLPTW